MDLLVDGGAVRCRVVLVGEPSVGKTSILSRLVQHQFHPNQTPTIGASYQIYVVDMNSIKIELQIWDTAGQEKFRALGPIYYRNATGAIAVFDITNRTSFENLGLWIASFTEAAGDGATLAIAGNKADLESAREVTDAKAREFAIGQKAEYYETSASTGQSIEQMFTELAKRIICARNLTELQAEQALLEPVQSSCHC
jgi:small GTP-binding protein